MRVGRLNLVGAMLVGLFFVACTPKGETPNAFATIPTLSSASIRSIANDYDIQLPLDAYSLSTAQFAVFQNSLDRAIATCMQQKGFTFQVALRPTEGLRPVNHRRYGLTDNDHAKIYGYQPLPRSAAEAAAIQRRAEMVRALSPEGRQALSGVRGTPLEVNQPQPTVGTGCTGEAVGSLGSEDWQRDQAFVDNLGTESYDRSGADPRVQDVFKKWATCMAEAGFHYKTPLDGNNDNWDRPEPPPDAFVERVEPLQPGSRELVVAARDAECNRQVNVAGIWMAYEAAYQRQLIEKHQEELSRIEADVSELLRNLGLGAQTPGG